MAREFRKQLLEHLTELHFFLKWRDANIFKVRAFENALEVLEGLDDGELRVRIEDGSLIKLEGIGKGILAVAQSFAKTQTSKEWAEAKGDLPISLLELTQLKGMGIKKIKKLYEDLQVSNLGELEYAARENQVAELEGFGTKTQASILESLQLIRAHSGKQLLSDAFHRTEKLEAEWTKAKVDFTPAGDWGRRSEIIGKVSYLIADSDLAEAKKIAGKEFSEIELLSAPATALATEKVYLTSAPEHWKSLEAAAQKKDFQLTPKSLINDGKATSLKDSKELYSKLGFDFHPPESREYEAVKKLPHLIERSQLKGVFHLHTHESDGADSLEAMAAAAQTAGFTYMGLSDHSQSSFYASGLKADALQAQAMVVKKMNAEFGEKFTILRGVESDILKDGSLDYPAETLGELDFVIASVHQRFGMKEMTERLITALENPHTTFLGHLTGRLLLNRQSYEVDMPKVIDAAIANGKIIELNSNPLRLEIDWRFLRKACEKGLLISINPDAHSTKAFEDVRYGVWLARKGLVPIENIVNAWPIADWEKKFGISLGKKSSNKTKKKSNHR